MQEQLLLNEVKAKKILIFHSALAPYRIDFFNEISKAFDATIVFLSTNLRNQKFDNEKLIAKTNFDIHYLSRKIVVADRDINFGYSSCLKKVQPDVVIGGEFGLPVIIPYLFRFFTKRKYKIVTICDDSLSIATNCSGLKKWIRKILITRLDGIILVNSEVGIWYSKNFYLKKTPLIFPILQDEKIFREQLEASVSISEEYIQKWNLQEKKVLLYVGRLAKVKGLELLLNAFAQSKIEDSCLVLVGDGEEKERLVALTKEFKISKKVFFVGRYEDLELLAWYNIGSVFVLPSHYEPFGAVINEALLAGCKVICSSKAGSSTLVNEHKNGKIYDPNDVSLLTRLIFQMIGESKVLTEKVIIKESLMLDDFDKNVISLVNFINEL